MTAFKVIIAWICQKTLSHETSIRQYNSNPSIAVMRIAVYHSSKRVTRWSVILCCPGLYWTLAWHNIGRRRLAAPETAVRESFTTGGFSGVSSASVLSSAPLAAGLSALVRGLTLPGISGSCADASRPGPCASSFGLEGARSESLLGDSSSSLEVLVACPAVVPNTLSGSNTVGDALELAFHVAR